MSDESLGEVPAQTTSDEPMSGPLPELDALGVRYHMEYGPARARFVNNVCIPWTPAQWVGVIHREGQWLGTCCGTISAIRVRLMQLLAEGGWASMRNLSEIIELMKSHDGFMDWFESGFTPDKDTLTNPLYLLVQVWDVVKDRRWASWLDVPAKLTPERRQETCGRTLGKALSYYNMVRMFHVGDYQDEAEKAKAQFRHNRDVTLALSRVVPALKEFRDSIHCRVLNPIEGVAIVRRNDRGVVLDTIGGPAIYQDEAEATKTIGYWCTNDQKIQGEEPPKTEDFELRRVMVTLHGGVEFVPPVA